MTRLLFLLVALSIAACGPGDDGTGSGPEPETEAAPEPEAPRPPVGSRAQGAQDVMRIVGELRRGDAESAREVLEQLADYRRQNAGLGCEIEAAHLSARILQDLERYEEAGVHYLDASTLAFGDEIVFLRIQAVQMFKVAEKFDRALSILEKLREEKPSGPSAREIPYEWARTLLEAGRDEEGFEAFRAIVRRFGDTAPAWHVRAELAGALVLRGRDEEGARELAVLWPEHEHKPVGQAAGVMLAQIAVRSGKPDTARTILERLDKFCERDISVEVNMMLLSLDRLGKPAPALLGTCLGQAEPRAEDLADRPTVVVFWDPGRPVSSLVMSRWSHLAHGKHRGRYNVVGFPLSADSEAVLREIRDSAIEAPQRQTGPETAERWGIVSVPWVVVVDPEGRLFSSGWPLGRTAGLPEVR